ncbi:MAG: phosphatidylserine/phosphatidylglycerophosphate/cardiolipin synthase family protein [Alphaproteobacteria bacterium]|nr:phosphatidylserine/phosphatidylglycerophosphate/cardiolipin synthase family protein [Alphaproteobacteria bacterium]
MTNNIAELIAGSNISPETLYMRIGRLIESMPDLANIQLTAETQKWLADAYALTKASEDLMESIEIKAAIDTLSTHAGYQGNSVYQRDSSARKIQNILCRVLAIAELKAPVSVQGSFIPAGGSFDAFAVISKVFSKANSEIIVVDPYLDKKIFTDFAAAIPENVTIKLLADEKDHKSTLQPAFKNWVKQYGNTRPVELKLAPNRSLHDRLVIVDNSEVWILTQSFNAFALRAPASIVRFQDPDTKIKAYENIWNTAKAV